MTKRNSLILGAMFVITGFGGLINVDASAQCDRECLKGVLTTYLDALIAKKTDDLPLDAKVKFTENCKEIKVGEGYWKDVSGIVRYRLDIVDVNQSGIAALVVIKGTASVLYAVRLKVDNQTITEIETIVTKNSSEGMLFTPDGFKAPPADSAMTKMPDSDLLNTREEMIEIASRYPEAMKKGIASFNKNGLYFSKDAYRLENGQLMAGPGCTFLSGCENIGTQGLPKLSGMIYKPALVDEQAGIVLLRMNFGKGSVMSGSGTLDGMEAFKVFNDSMHCVYAIMRNVPEGTEFGWDYDPVGVRRSIPAAAIAHETIPVAGGVLVPIASVHDDLVLDIYTTAGRLVTSKSVAPVRKSGMLFLPLNKGTLSAGHFIGCVRAGRENIGSGQFPVNVVR